MRTTCITIALKTTAGTTGAGTEVHDATEDDPRDARPLGDIGIGNDAGGGDEGNDVEKGGAESMLYAVVETRQQQAHDPQRGGQHNAEVELELRVLEECSESQLENTHI